MRRPRLGRAVVLAILGAASIATAVGAQPFPIGHRLVTYTDPARGNRSVQTDVYYPAEMAGDNTNAAAGSFPVLAFGHGFLMPASVYTFLWDGLVPAGYVMCLPRTEGTLSPSHDAFAGDLAFLVDKLRSEGATNGSPFFGRIGPAAAVMGHSMGGGASLLAAAAGNNITAVANLAAAETNPSAVQAASGLTIPALLFAGSSDCVTPPAQHQIPMYDALGSVCKTLVTITGASHCQFAESNFTCSLGEVGCAAGITRAQQHDAVLLLLRPWLDAFLKSDAVAFATFQQRRSAGAGFSSRQDCAAVDTPDPGRAPDPGTETIAAEPNPFHDRVSLRFTLTGDAGEGALPRDPAARFTASDDRVQVEIYDVAGRLVRGWRLIRTAAVPLALEWDGRDARGHAVRAGSYLVRVRSRAGEQHRTIVRLPGRGN